MKKYLAFLTTALFATCSACHRTEPAVASQPSMADKTETAVDSVAQKTKDMATDAKNAITDKIAEWNLTPSDIKADLEKSGRVVRSKTAAAGAATSGAIDNARIVTVIKSKYLADPDLSALKINVDDDNGVVTLHGTAGSDDLIGKAVALALDTDGVHQVVSLLTVEAK